MIEKIITAALDNCWRNEAKDQKTGVLYGQILPIATKRLGLKR
jgi:hypothetical protein